MIAGEERRLRISDVLHRHLYERPNTAGFIRHAPAGSHTVPGCSIEVTRNSNVPLLTASPMPGSPVSVVVS